MPRVPSPGHRHVLRNALRCRCRDALSGENGGALVGYDIPGWTCPIEGAGTGGVRSPSTRTRGAAHAHSLTLGSPIKWRLGAKVTRGDAVLYEAPTHWVRPR